MNDAPLPEDLLVEIIHKFVEEATRTDWLRLRLVNSMFQGPLHDSVFRYMLELTMDVSRVVQSRGAFHRLCA